MTEAQIRSAILLHAPLINPPAPPECREKKKNVSWGDLVALSDGPSHLSLSLLAASSHVPPGAQEEALHKHAGVGGGVAG